MRYGLGISDHDSEGRLVTVEFDSFYLLCSYVPNSGDGLKRLVSGMEILVNHLLGSFLVVSSYLEPDLIYLMFSHTFFYKN